MHAQHRPIKPLGTHGTVGGYAEEYADLCGKVGMIIVGRSFRISAESTRPPRA